MITRSPDVSEEGQLDQHRLTPNTPKWDTHDPSFQNASEKLLVGIKLIIYILTVINT